MVNASFLPEEDIFNDLCNKYDIKKDVIENLIKIERNYQDYERRRGIYEEIKNIIRSSLDK
jgi:hypothetical protein